MWGSKERGWRRACLLPSLSVNNPLFRPPAEADSLILQVDQGCPHNRCTFCGMYRGVPYRRLPLEDVRALIRAEARGYPDAGRIFLADGDVMSRPFSDLQGMLQMLNEAFPALARVSVYANGRSIAAKTDAQLRALRALKLHTLYMGLESGDDEILARVRKGADSRVQIEAGRLARQAGIELNTYVILGLGGREGTYAHARKTARVLNEMAPPVVRLRTLVPKINTPLLEEVQAGRLELLGPHGVIRETMALIEGLNGRLRVVSDHYTNYVNLAGNLPEDKAAMLRFLEKHLAREEGSFRPFFIGTQ